MRQIGCGHRFIVRRRHPSIRRPGYAVLVIFALISGLAGVEAEANPYAPHAAKFLGEYFLGKALDEVWSTVTGTPNLKELDVRLKAFENALNQVDRTLSRSVEQLREELDSKTTKAEVRQVVLDVLARLDDRIKELDQRVDRLDNRVKEIEEAIGLLYLPTVPPAPVRPTAASPTSTELHPLTVQWALLLVKSLQNLLDIESKSATHGPQNQEIGRLQKVEKQIIEETLDLHEATIAASGPLIHHRATLVGAPNYLKPADARVRDVDQKLATLLWLRVVTRPITEGKLRGRLPVPTALLGPSCTDIVCGLEAAGVAPEKLTPIFRYLLRSRAAIECVPGDAVPPEKLEDLARRSRKVLSVAHEVALQAQVTEGQLERSLRADRDRYRDARAQQARQTESIRALHRQSDTLLEESLICFVGSLKEEPPTTARMHAFHKNVLQPLYALNDVTSCVDWDVPVCAIDTWQRFSAYEPNNRRASDADEAMAWLTELILRLAEFEEKSQIRAELLSGPAIFQDPVILEISGAIRREGASAKTLSRVFDLHARRNADSDRFKECDLQTKTDAVMALNYSALSALGVEDRKLRKVVSLYGA